MLKAARLSLRSICLRQGGGWGAFGQDTTTFDGLGVARKPNDLQVLNLLYEFRTYNEHEGA